MTPSRKPSMPSRKRRNERRDALSARLGRSSGRTPINAPKAAGRRAAADLLTGARASAERLGPVVRGQILPTVAKAIVWTMAMGLRTIDLIAKTIARLTGALVSVAITAWALLMALLAKADRAVTPARATAAIVLAAAVCLGVSQFADYRGVQVGEPGYQGLEAVAGAPQAEVKKAGSAHGYLLLPLAALAAGLALLALRSGRWQLARLVAICGAVGVAVALAIDLPKGLDEGDAGLAYAGTKATLNDGFYAELAASATLALMGLVLAMHLRRAGPSPATAPRQRRGSRLSSSPSVAGGRP